MDAASKTVRDGYAELMGPGTLVDGRRYWMNEGAVWFRRKDGHTCTVRNVALIAKVRSAAAVTT